MDNRILKLDARTADKIAAGEVVERPSAVVKELVENAVDAGATEVIVDVKRGGKGQIRVTDNGSGIYEGDLDLVFERHATSKIRSIEDLNSTKSLGFRGEALASICAVSQVELITMRRDAETGIKVTAAGGMILKKTPVGTVPGTSISVKDLFFNTPARLKFLKSDQAEGRAITELMSHLALSHPEVAFKYMLDDKRVFDTPGNGRLADAILSVYEPGLIKQLQPIEDSLDSMRLHGFISKFELTRGTRNQQLAFVNGRYVKSDLIKEIVHLAYKPYLMNNRFPVCFLFLELPPETVDVNVHPAKTEIKFHDEGRVKQLIYTALKKAFNLYDQVPDVAFTAKPVTPPEPIERSTEAAPFIKRESGEAAKFEPAMKSEQLMKSEPLSMKTAQRSEQAKERFQNAVADKDPGETATQSDTGALSKSVRSSGKVNPPGGYGPGTGGYRAPSAAGAQIDFSILEEMGHFASTHAEPVQPMQEASVYEGLTYIGTFDKTYLIYEKTSQLYLIDQHAAHEKILYEQFMQAFEKEGVLSQGLLIPIKIELDVLGMARFAESGSLIAKMGFSAEQFGPKTILLREIPSLMSPSSAKDMFLSVMEDNIQAVDASKQLEIATRACKAAIKANDLLMPIETDALLQSLMGLEDPYTCPHGRPIVVRFSKNEIDKKFKRIL
jgi:DNA mismatch repair protein MutL